MLISYDPTLVMLSIFVAITGCVTGLTLTAGYGQGYRRSTATGLIKGAVIIGGSIWSMHFVAMLAVRFPVLVNYQFVETMVSLYVAVFGTGLGLFIVSGRHMGWASIPIGGTMMGLAIAGMHYLGMSAIRGCGITYDMEGVALSVGLAIVAAMVALWFTFRRRGTTETLIGGLMLGMTIPVMHYTAMYATSFQRPTVVFELTSPILSQDILAFIIASATLLICGIFLFLFSKLALDNVEQVESERYYRQRR